MSASETLASTARRRLCELGYENVSVHCDDGTLGLAEHAPYDAIAVAAAGPDLPHALVEQLAEGGRMVIPVGPRHAQKLVRVTKLSAEETRVEMICDVSFVPLVGAAGWPLEEASD